VNIVVAACSSSGVIIDAIVIKKGEEFIPFLYTVLGNKLSPQFLHV